MEYVGTITENAKTVDASGCTGLEKLEAPNAEYVYASGCTGLEISKINSPIARTVEKFIIGELGDLLSAGGRQSEALREDHWTCNSWDNCPMAAAFGVNSLNSIPALWKPKAEFFVSQYDNGLIRRDDALKACGVDA